MMEVVCDGRRKRLMMEEGRWKRFMMEEGRRKMEDVPLRVGTASSR